VCTGGRHPGGGLDRALNVVLAFTARSCWHGRVSTHLILLGLHLLGAAIWTGGHLVLALRVLPRALREKNAALVRDFERAFEPVGLPALLLQIVTGIALALDFSPDPSHWVSMSPGYGRATGVKLALLLLTLLLALHARLRLIPRLSDERLAPLAWHIALVTLAAVAFVLVGLSFRAGGLT
jgi:putative copper export protein